MLILTFQLSEYEQFLGHIHIVDDCKNVERHQVFFTIFTIISYMHSIKISTILKKLEQF